LDENNVEKQQRSIHLLNKLVTRRQHVSLSNIQEGSIFYQSVVVVNGNIYYCLVDEADPYSVYYHPDQACLAKKINEVIIKQK